MTLLVQVLSLHGIRQPLARPAQADLRALGATPAPETPVARSGPLCAWRGRVSRPVLAEPRLEGRIIVALGGARTCGARRAAVPAE